MRIIGILTALSKFTISYRSDKGVTNVLYAGFHEVAKPDDTPPIFTMKSNMRDPKVVKFTRDIDPELILVVGWYHMIRLLSEKFRIRVSLAFTHPCLLNTVEAHP